MVKCSITQVLEITLIPYKYISLHYLQFVGKQKRDTLRKIIGRQSTNVR